VRELARAQAQAEDLWLALLSGRRPIVGSLFSCDVGVDVVPEIGSALLELISDQPLATRQELLAATELWHWLAASPWPENEFDEQANVLAAIAFMLGSGYRRQREYRAMREWEERCAALIGDLEPNRSYLALFAASSSSTVSERVLDDPALLLTFCRQHDLLRNQKPSVSLRTATRAFHAVTQKIASGASTEDLGYLAFELAMTVAISAVHLRQGEVAVAWVQAADWALGLTPNCSWLQPIVDGLRIVVLFALGEGQAVLSEAPSVIRELEILGADRNVMSVLIAQAQCLKNVKRHKEAIEILERLTSTYADGEQSRLGIAYAHLADAKTETGDVAGAIRDCQIAYPLLRDSGLSFGIPSLQAIVGQLFRVMGRTGDALSALREAATNYSEQDFRAWAGYARILAAETLLLAERAPEALEELLVALELLEGSGAEQELWAAVRLLRSALAATKPATSHLRRCRERLELIRNSHL